MIKPALPRPPLSHQHDYNITASDLVIVRWCTTCGETDKIERYVVSEPFQSHWHRIKEQDELL